MNEKIYYINAYRRGKHRIIKGTIKQLAEHFDYTLECGHSWNPKINRHPTTYKGLVSAINKSYRETMGSCYDPNFVEEATENDYLNAESLGYETSDAGQF